MVKICHYHTNIDTTLLAWSGQNIIVYTKVLDFSGSFITKPAYFPYHTVNFFLTGLTFCWTDCVIIDMKIGSIETCITNLYSC
jgi:hypothetical protein